VGEEAAGRLRFHTLDITDDSSVTAFAEHIRVEHGGLDVLVHNAGFAFPNASTEPFPEQARRTLGTNFWGTRRAARALHPLLRPGARVAFVSSSCGHLSKINGAEPAAAALRQQLASNTLTDEALCRLVEDFLAAAAAGSHVTQGWPDSAYKVSKVAVSALARVTQWESERERREVVVNHCHPGWLATEMTGGKGHWPVEKGVVSLVRAATLPQGTAVRGAFLWEDGEETSWEQEQVNLFY